MYLVGIDVGGTYTKIGVINRKGHLLYHSRFLTPPEGGPGKFIELLEERWEQISLNVKKRTDAIGVGVPGFVDYKHGFIHKLVNIKGWQNVYLRRMLQQKFQLPTYVDNDVNCMVLGETKFGAAKGAKYVLGVTLGTGVGGGIVIDGKVYRGTTYTAGEIGHITVVKDGPLCNCGNRGCLETFVGNRRIIERVKRDIKEGVRTKIREIIKGDMKSLTPEVITLAAKMGDRYAIKLWKDLGEYIGIVLAGLINTLNPQLIVIGGGIANSGRFLFTPIRQTVRERGVPVAVKGVKIKKAKLEYHSGIIGAASLCVEGE